MIPLWVDQIKSDKPITVTDPNMARYMMTLDDAVDLVLYAFEHGRNGDLFVRKRHATTLKVAGSSTEGAARLITRLRLSAHDTARSCTKRWLPAKRWWRKDMGNYYRIPCDEGSQYDKYFIEGNEDISVLRIIIRIIPDNWTLPE